MTDSLRSGRPFHRAPCIAALVTAVGVFPLLFVGAGVTSKDAGMVYPDWPTSAGRIINPRHWWQTEATRWEHGHRLIGWVVGLSAVVLAAAAWPAGGAIRRLGIITLLAIGLQGVLGGLRVIWDSTPLALVHGVWGQVCFCLAGAAALRASRWWNSVGVKLELRSGRGLRRLCVFTAASIFVQLALGATLRHLSSGHALVAHVLWAIVVIALVDWLAMWVAGHGFGLWFLKFTAKAMAVLASAQLLVGGFAWLVTMGGPDWSSLLKWLVPTIHVGIGALVLLCSVLLTMAVFRRVGMVDEAYSPVKAIISAL